MKQRFAFMYLDVNVKHFPFSSVFVLDFFFQLEPVKPIFLRRVSRQTKSSFENQNDTLTDAFPRITEANDDKRRTTFSTVKTHRKRRFCFLSCVRFSRLASHPPPPPPALFRLFRPSEENIMTPWLNIHHDIPIGQGCFSSAASADILPLTDVNVTLEVSGEARVLVSFSN